MKLSKDVKPITYLKNHAADLVESVATNHQTMVITQHGEARVVLMPIDDYERWQDALAMLKILAMSQEQFREGQGIPQEEVFRRVADKHGLKLERDRQPAKAAPAKSPRRVRKAA